MENAYETVSNNGVEHLTVGTETVAEAESATPKRRGGRKPGSKNVQRSAKRALGDYVLIAVPKSPAVQVTRDGKVLGTLQGLVTASDDVGDVGVQLGTVSTSQVRAAVETELTLARSRVTTFETLLANLGV